MTTKENFLAVTAEHQLTIVRDDGLHRHITLKKHGSSAYGFHITTWPGYLAISGDAGCYVFARLTDMFEFFRGDDINPGYWGEKLQAVDRSGGYRAFSEDRFREAIKDDFAQWDFDVDGDPEQEAAARAKAWAEIQGSGLADDDMPDSISDAIQRAMDYECPISGNTFSDFWDHDLEDFTYRFLWCCHAIQWAIGKYKAAKSTVPAPAVSPQDSSGGAA